MKKFFILVIFILIISVSYAAHRGMIGTKLNLPIIDFKRIQTIKIQDLTVDNKEIWFDGTFLNNQPIKTEDELYEAIRRQFYLQREDINQYWNINDEDLLFTLYAMNITSNLWGYGNPNQTDKVGCVYKNEDYPNGRFASSDDLSLHIPEYLASRIGCCSDHARMMHLLLTKAGIENRYMLNPGHVFTEAFIQGKWQAFDATTNMWWHDSWEEIQNYSLTAPIFVTIFPVVGTVKSHKNYRPFLAIFRHYMLLEAVYKMAQDIKHPEKI